MSDAPTTVPTARSLKQWNSGKKTTRRRRSMQNDQAKKSHDQRTGRTPLPVPRNKTLAGP